MKKKAREKPHYVNNKQFSGSVVDYVNSANEARDKGEEEPIITEYIGSCFLKIAEGLSHKPNFSGYTYREEMVMDAVENCIKAIMNYDVKKATRTGLPNAFAYFTQITYYAFIRRIQKEKRQMETKFKYIKSLDVDAILADGEGSTDYLEYMRNIIDQAEAEEAKSKKENEGKKIHKRRPKYLDEKIKAKEKAEAEAKANESK